MRITLRKLSHVLAVAETGSFARACEKLNISQPALSRSISSIEAAFEVTLFDRSRSGVALTAVGATLVEEARDLSRRAAAVESNLALWSKAEAGAIAFGIGPWPGSILLPDLIAALAASHPKLHLRAVIGSTERLLEDLNGDKIEFYLNALVLNPYPEGVSVERLGAWKMGFFVRSGHPLSGRTDVTFDDLRDFPLAGATANPLRRLSENPNNSAFPKYEPTVECDDYHVLRDAVLRSDLIWTSSTQLLPESGIVELAMSPESSYPPVSLIVASPQGRTRSPAAKLVISHLAQGIRTRSH